MWIKSEFPSECMDKLMENERAFYHKLIHTKEHGLNNPRTQSIIIFVNMNKSCILSAYDDTSLLPRNRIQNTQFL